MLNLTKLFSLEKLKENLVNIWKRFPITLVILFTITTLFFIVLHWELTSLQENEFFRYILSLIITFFLSLWVYLTTENLDKLKINKHILQLFPIVFWVLFYITFKTNFQSIDDMIYFILTLTWIIWYFYIAPFIKKIISNKSLDEIYYSYFYNISVVILMSFILWWVLFALWSIWITAVFALFDIKDLISEKIYWDWAILALSFITPVFALTQIPAQKTFNKKSFIENKFFSFLVKYIAIPFIYIYFIILYTYSIKVLLNFWDWPKWEVSWMVIWFSIFGYLIYMFLNIFEEENRYIKFFRKYFPAVVIPQLFMLFYAIYLRINQYDITMNRYFVVVFGIWLVIISLYFAFSKLKQIYFIPTILTIFTIIISIGPWWVYSLPEARQLKRLENNLSKAWVLQSWKIVPLKEYSDIETTLSKEIYNWIDYLCDYNDCNSIKTLFSEMYSDLYERKKKEFEEIKTEDEKNFKNDEKYLKEVKSRVYNWPSSWEIVSEITTQIKVKSYFDDNYNSPNIYLYIDSKEWIFPLDINWYSKIFKINSYFGDEKIGNVKYTNKNTLEVKENGILIDELDLSEVSKKLSEVYNKTKNNVIPKENMIYELNWKDWVYKLILENININNPAYTGSVDWKGYTSIDGYLLTK